MPAKKSMMRLKKSVRFRGIQKAASRFAKKPTAWPIAAVAVGIVAAGILMAGRGPSATVDTSIGNVQLAHPALPQPAELTAIPAPADSSSKAAGEKAIPVTITGCLEQKDDTFRLKDTSGADAPRARSWKTGFLKKGSPSINVVDATNRVRLTSHVGQRVSVTGLLIDREMQVRSLQRVAPSCEKIKA